MRLSSICGLALLLAGFGAQAQDRVQNLAGKWRFHPGDDARWAAPDFDDSLWAEIDVPKSWKDAGYPTLSGYGWYRTVVQIPAEMQGRDYGIYFAAVDDAYEVYANGTRIGIAGSLGDKNGQKQSGNIWSLTSNGVAKDGKVLLAVRVWMTPDIGGIIDEVLGSSPAFLTTYSERNRTNQRNAVLVSLQPTFLQGIVGLLTGLFVLLLYFFDRSHREYLWFGGWNLVLPLAIGVFMPSLIDGGQLPAWFQSLIRTILGVCTIQFVWLFLGMRPGWWVRLVQGASILALAITLIQWKTFGAGGLFYVIVCFSCTYVLVRRIRSMLIEEVLFSATLLLDFLSRGTATFLGSLANFGIIPPTISTWYDQAMNARIHGMPVYLPNIAMTIAPCLMMLVLLRRFQRTHREELRMRGELESARAMQSLMATAVKAPGFVTETEYRPASEVGGDFYQILPSSDGSILVVVGDVSGKGMKAAMLASAVIGALGDLASNSPGDVLAHLNRAVAGKTHGGFVTCCCTRFCANGEVSIANAGHLAPYLKGAEVEVNSGLPLGLALDAEYAETRLTLEPGAALTFLSDGVIEAANKQGELFGFDRTREISRQPAQQIAQAANDWGQNDDITVVTVRRDALPAV